MVPPIYDLVAIDLDGTLVDARNNISEIAERSVREVRSAGIKVVLVTGRPQVAALPIFSRLGLALPLISSGGAYVSDPASGRLIAEFMPAPGPMTEFVELARERHLTLVLQTPEAMFGEGSAPILDELRTANSVPIEAVEDGLLACPEPIKVTCCGPRGLLNEITDEITRRGIPLSLVLSGPEFLEATAAGVSKGRALVQVADYLGVSLEHVLVIGDAPNDISMFGEAGLAVAMGNAGPDVQAVADVIAPAIEEDGVAWALRRFVLGND